MQPEPLRDRVHRFLILEGIFASIILVLVVTQQLSIELLTLLSNLAAGIAMMTPVALLFWSLWKRNHRKE